MRRTLLVLFSVLFLQSCVNEELPMPDEVPVAGNDYNTYILASVAETKAVISDDYAKLGWNKNDTLSVYTSSGRFVDFVYDLPMEDGVVRFKGILDDGERIDRYAVFPSGDHVVTDGNLYVDLPEEYMYEEGNVKPVMMADMTSSSDVVSFNHLGGMLAFDVKGVPAGATSFTFETDKAVTGIFPVRDNEITVLEKEHASTVTFTFPPSELLEDMKFFVPVPVGEYTGFTVSILADGETINTRSSSKTNLVSRTELKKFSFEASDIVYVTVDGAGDRSGKSWDDATTLSAALAGADDGQVIRMAGGVYVPDTCLDGAAQKTDVCKTFLVRNNVTIQGSYKAGTSQVDTAATPTVISGQVSDGVKAYHAMVVASSAEGQTVLRGLTFKDSSPMSVNTDELVSSAPATVTSDGIAVFAYRGGGLYAGSDVAVISCIIENNTSAFHSKTNGTVGMGLYVASGIFADVRNTTFRANAGGACGGAVYSQGSLELENCLFERNSSTHAGAVHNGGRTVVTGCVFRENDAMSGFAGALRHQGSSLRIRNSVFMGNHAANHGGAIQNNRNIMNIDNCVFDSNISDSNGGAIANWGGATADLMSCTFVANSAREGGAVVNMINDVSDQMSQMTLNKCAFTSNKAVCGGAVANLGSKAEVANADFDENLVSGYGGAIYNAFDMAPATMDIKASSFSGNTSEGNGGAVMNWYAEKSSGTDASEMSIANSSFVGNRVISKNAYASQGGAVANQCAVLSVTGTEFIGNHAAHAGAIYSYDYELNGETAISDKVAYTYIYNSVFDSNTVDLSANGNAQGSHYRSHGKSLNVIVNSTFKGGDSPTGAVRLRTGASCWLVSCTFTENVSGPYNQSSVMKVYNTVSYGNTKHDYYANQTDGTDYLQSSFIGTMYINGGRQKDGCNSIYDESARVTDYFASPALFGAFKDGVYPVVEEPALSSGMTNEELSELAMTIKYDMPDLETKYFIRDQKDCPREQNEKVMGAYIGDVYLDPDRNGYLNNTELIEENNLRGLITDETGKPIEGVAVSDGYDVVTTDANGVYQFEAHPDARILSVSVPADYEIPYKNNRPDFWVPVVPTDSEVRTDFTFRRRSSSSDDFTIFSLADTHVQTAEHYRRFSTETMPDLENLVASGNHNPNSFAVILGDIMFDSYEQVENVKASLQASPVPVFPCFGNHDCSSSAGTTELELISKYQHHFGPVDYSFNIGKAHVVFMKNMIYEGSSPYGKEGHGYVQGILDHQLEWLKKDLAAVPDKQDKLIIMCVHIPLRGTANTSRNYKAVVNQMLQFKEAHVLSGHHHGVYNHIPATDVTVGGKTFYDHNQVAAAGAWWSSNLNPDGSPNGYMVYNVSGNTVNDFALKATGHDDGYQMRVYDGGVTYSVPSPAEDYNNQTKLFEWGDLGMDLSGKFVVHVFNADTRNWQVNFVQNGVSTSMTRTSTAWYDMASYAFAAYYTGWSSGGKERYSSKVANTNFWYIDAPSGNPVREKDWYVEAVHTVNGKSVRYTSSQLHDKYTGFAY